MANAATWARRVAAWKGSGLTSEAFCRGKPFTAGGLRYWAHKLRQERPDKTDQPVIRIGRVLRRRPLAEATAKPAQPGVDEKAEAIVVEVGAVRVAVRPGFDRLTLATVLDLLSTRGGTR